MHRAARLQSSGACESRCGWARIGGKILSAQTPRGSAHSNFRTSNRRETPMRVMHIVSGRLYGGVETLLVTLARCRDLSTAMEPEFALCFDGRLREELAETGAPVHLLGEVRARHPVSVMRARRQLRELLNTRSIDVVLCHLPWAEAVFGMAARRAGIPLVFWMHGPAEARGWLERWAALTPPDAAICNSKYTAKSLPMIFPGIPFEVIYLPVRGPELDRQSQDKDRLQV